ncbi:Cof-type HAD-IIB family hydrolase [Lancefieldella sp. Marseille-Q7238]|uniref:Cof-type HAD-IIB family hydrolase n=1 Tax=Lancefieldella sp. Marseille-Q7238 TaxID=3022127 RepID=UPI0024A9FE0D|nr:Cof-type HAD-IIB family hydrolase [Lancefieldella sp. Marseille-Q7238]
MPSYKLIASDLDETLLDSNHCLPENARKAILAARNKGVKFVPASGRNYQSIQITLKELGLYDQPNEYTISFNSGVITENKGNRVISMEGISRAFANEVLQRALALGNLCVHVYTAHKIWAWNVPEIERRYTCKLQKMDETDEPNLDFLADEQIIKCLVMNTNVAYLHQLAQEWQDITDDIDVSFSANRYLEFNKKGVNKGTGLLRLGEILDIPAEEIIAIGDNYNDLPMVKTAGLGVLMANAPKELKCQADYVTTLDNNAGGVAEVIEKFVLS